MEGGYRKSQSQRWLWLRVYYFEECKDDLILDGVWPAVQAAHLTEPESRAYFQRDWLGGPNVLVGLRSACPPSNKSPVAEQIGEYLKAHPSNRQFSAVQLSKLGE